MTYACKNFKKFQHFYVVKLDQLLTGDRYSGTCHRMECPVVDGQLRTVTDYLAGLEEILGYIVNSVSTSIG